MTAKPHLPGILQRIADVAGEGAALAIARDFGGRRLSLPRRAKPNTVLARCVGLEATEKIVGAIGHGEVEIPIADTGSYNSMIRGKARLIDDLERQNVSGNEIARRAGVTRRTVTNHRQRHAGRRDSKQLRLF